MGETDTSDTGGGEGASQTRYLPGRDVKLDRIEVWLKENFEPTFFKFRYAIAIPVFFSFLGALVMFGVGIYQTVAAVDAFIGGSFDGVSLPLIKALDAYLIGIILVIFSFGVYDFFISELEPAENSGLRPDWLKFDNVGQLKNKIIEVVIVVLVIAFFELMIANYHSFDTLYGYLTIPIGTTIMAIGVGLFKKLTHPGG